ncbi:MAG: nucleotide exchange factor GrpE [Clostridia bacterium]|nr:nucleotide exchange factor GrpE [Clostridia bacterium]
MSEKEEIKEEIIEEVIEEPSEAEKLKAELDKQKDDYLRLLAEYDNFKKRNIKEKEGMYIAGICDAVEKLIPVLDNIERAIDNGNDLDSLKEGVELIKKQCLDSFKALGVEEIETDTFDPNLHNAVMHVEDEELGENKIVDVFQKGYKKGDKIIRISMVKVAN